MRTYRHDEGGELRRRAELLEDFQSMMIEVKGHINYFREPLPDILSNWAKTVNQRPFLSHEGRRHA